MRRGLLILDFLLAGSVLLFAQEAVPQDAKVLQDREVFRMSSPTEGELQVTREVVVYNKSGRDAAATLLLYTDAFRSLKSFKGEVLSLQGKGKAMKMGTKDLVTVSLTSGLANDGVVISYAPEGVYPFLVHYEYVISYKKGIASFPSFFPVEEEKVSVSSASYTIDVPEGFVVRSCFARMEPSFSSEDGRDRYEWTLQDFPGCREEEMMPSSFELLPYVFAAPETINYGGYEGTQSSWKEIGQWLAQMQEGSLELPPDAVQKVESLTRDCKNDYEKLAALYAWLRSTTRYVSIQLGIGGLRPFPAADVYKTGFGDCKGLSNYMKAMLKAAGVESEYFIINTDRASLLPDYASVGQMNHAMVAVPLPEWQDTVWVECTNPSIPLGYRHEDAAGHEIVLVKENGGELVRIPAYPDSLSRQVQKTRVILSQDGSARLELRKELFLDLMEPYIGFSDLAPDTKLKMLTRAMKLHPDSFTVGTVSDNFGDYPLYGRAFVPKIQIDYALTTGVYANRNGERLFVPLNPVALMLPFQKGERVNDWVIDSGVIYEDEIILVLPEGYHVESLPADTLLEEEWGCFTSRVRESEEGIVIHQRIALHSCRYPASTYDRYRQFARAVNKQYAATLVLKKD